MFSWEHRLFSSVHILQTKAHIFSPPSYVLAIQFRELLGTNLFSRCCCCRLVRGHRFKTKDLVIIMKNIKKPKADKLKLCPADAINRERCHYTSSCMPSLHPEFTVVFPVMTQTSSIFKNSPICWSTFLVHFIPPLQRQLHYAMNFHLRLCVCVCFFFLCCYGNLCVNNKCCTYDML